MPKKDKEINTPEAPEGSDAKDIQKWSVWSQGPKDAKETQRKFKQTTPGQVRDYKHFVSSRRFTKYEQVEIVQPKNEDAPANSVAGGGVDMAPNAKGTKVFMKKFRVDGRTKQYRETNRRIKERQEKLMQQRVQAKLANFGIAANPFAEETENKKYFETKDGSIEDAIISALTNFENPNKDKETLTLPNKKDVEVEETYKGKEKRKADLGGNKRKDDRKKFSFAQKAEAKKSGYLEPDMKKRQDNNEKARKDMKKMGTPMKNPHLEEVETEGKDVRYNMSKLTPAQKKAAAETSRKGHDDFAAKMKKKGISKKIAVKKESKLDELSNTTMSSYAQKASTSQSDAEKKQDYKTADKRISGKMRASRRKFSNDTNRILKGLKKESKETENGERDAGSDKYTNYTKEMTPGQGITNPDAKKADVRKKKELAAQQQQLNVDEDMKYFNTRPGSIEEAILKALMPERFQKKHEKGEEHDEQPEKNSKKLDKVDKDELKGKHKDRDDKDIDNDGDSDDSDKFLHRRRKAISKKMDKEDAKEEVEVKEKTIMGVKVKKLGTQKDSETADVKKAQSGDKDALVRQQRRQKVGYAKSNRSEEVETVVNKGGPKSRQLKDPKKEKMVGTKTGTKVVNRDDPKYKNAPEHESVQSPWIKATVDHLAKK